MVMIKKGDGTINWAGKFGGTVFRDDQCRQHAQKVPRPIKRQPSPDQSKRQKAFQLLLQIVRRCFSAELAAYWQDYANKHPHKNKKGELITLTWHQMFISYNINRVVDDEVPDLVPPGYELIGAVPEWCEQFL